jgi:hypothetical protein
MHQLMFPALNSCLRNRSLASGIASNSGDSISVNYLEHLIMRASSIRHFILSSLEWDAFKNFEEGKGTSQYGWTELGFPLWRLVGRNEGKALLYYGMHINTSDTDHNMHKMPSGLPSCKWTQRLSSFLRVCLSSSLRNVQLIRHCVYRTRTQLWL